MFFSLMLPDWNPSAEGSPDFSVSSNSLLSLNKIAFVVNGVNEPAKVKFNSHTQQLLKTLVLGPSVTNREKNTLSLKLSKVLKV